MAPPAASVGMGVGNGARAGEEEYRLIYYADALPQYATKLIRIDAPVTGDREADWEAWKSGRCERWHPHHGWRRYPDGKMQIMCLGIWDQIDPDEVVQVQANTVAAYEQYRAQ